MWQARFAQEAERLTDGGADGLGGHARSVFTALEKIGPPPSDLFVSGTSKIRLIKMGHIGRDARAGLEDGMQTR